MVENCGESETRRLVHSVGMAYPTRHDWLVIVRILTAKVPAENIGLFNDLLRAQLKELQEQPGLVYAKLARRLDENQSEEVVLVEEWRTPSDLFEWTRGRLTRPRLLPGTEDLIANLIITHYEALDVAPEDLALRVLGADATARSAGGSEAEERRPEPIYLHRDPEAGSGGNGSDAAPRPRLVATDVLERPVVHVRGREQRTGRHPGREVGDGGRDDVAAPGILDRQG